MEHGRSMTRLERNLTLYPLYVVIFNAFFSMPIFALYFLERLTPTEVLRLEAVYYAVVVLLEIPSGYASDRFGRTWTLLISAAGIVAANVAFVVGDTFMMLAAAQVCFAIGISFNSGTDTAFHYDTLHTLGRQDEYDRREARIARLSFFSMAAAALVGGMVGLLELRLVYVVAAIVTAANIVVVLAMAEPDRDATQAAERQLLPQVAACVRYLRGGALRWLTLFVLFTVIINHIPYEFYQPYLKLIGTEVDWLGAGATPLVSGGVTAVTMLAAGMFAGRSIRLRDRIGTGYTLVLAAALQAAIIVIMAMVLHWVIVFVILLRSVPRGLSGAPLNAAVAPRVDRGHRATFLSLQSLVGRLGFAGFLLMLSVTGPASPDASWAWLSSVLGLSSGFAIVGTLLLAVLMPRSLRRDHRPPTT